LHYIPSTNDFSYVLPSIELLPRRARPWKRLELASWSESRSRIAWLCVARLICSLSCIIWASKSPWRCIEHIVLLFQYCFEDMLAQQTSCGALVTFIEYRHSYYTLALFRSPDRGVACVSPRIPKQSMSDYDAIVYERRLSRPRIFCIASYRGGRNIPKMRGKRSETVTSTVADRCRVCSDLPSPTQSAQRHVQFCQERDVYSSRQPTPSSNGTQQSIGRLVMLVVTVWLTSALYFEDRSQHARLALSTEKHRV
jgi:hypothetical protein